MSETWNLNSIPTTDLTVISDVLSANGYMAIKKTDHELLLAALDKARNEYTSTSEQLDTLRKVRYNAKIMEACNVIDTLTKLLAIPKMSYLDEFCKPVNNVSPVNAMDIRKINRTIMDYVDQLAVPTHKPLTEVDWEALKKT